jgi:hypothetical protein
LTGPIPSEIGRLFLLEDLNLEQNELTTLPAELGNLILLRFLSLSKNNITGLLPPQIGSLINVLTLDLSENALSGVIPTEMGNLFLIRGMLSICVAYQCVINRVSQSNVYVSDRFFEFVFQPVFWTNTKSTWSVDIFK